jgi:exopolyphosphatase/guanosine-5'-triphosphate,3'-diphosphate pyrophosphatase
LELKEPKSSKPILERKTMRGATFKETRFKVNKISLAYNSDPEHSKHVTCLALEIFEALKPLHGYGKIERQILEIASRLHDIGWSQTSLKKHHKLSGDMILEQDIPGFDNKAKIVCALVARYHTKALPNPARHQKFAALSLKSRNVVEWLAAILRVADALDSNHASIISKLKIQINRNKIVVNLKTNGKCWDEIRRAHRKETLLVKKAGRTMVYQC